MSSEVCPASAIPNISGEENRIYLENAPLSWTGLHELAQQEVVPRLPLARQNIAAWEVFDAALKLSTKDRERARFYAEGLLTCLVGQEIIHGIGREALVEGVARRVALGHDAHLAGLAEKLPDIQVDASAGLQVAECFRLGMSFPSEHHLADYAVEVLRPGVTDRYNRLPVAERLVANVLAQTVPDSKRQLYPYFPAVPRAFSLLSILQGDEALEGTLLNTFEGATTLLAEALMQQTGRSEETKEVFDLAYNPILSICTPDELRGFIPDITARRAAALRVDQLNALHRYASLVGGALQLNPPDQATAPPPPPPSPFSRVYTRTEPYICPAMPARVEDVDGSRTPLVPLVAPLMVDMIVRASELIAAERP